MIKAAGAKFCCVAAFCLVAATAAAEGGINKLSWMTGTWSGAVGEGVVLEENWTVPRDGSIQSLVRVTAGGATAMVELIVVEESGDGLVLHLQQWGPGYESRGPATKMRSTNVGEREVSFEVEGEGAFKTLSYKRPADDKFEIHVDSGEGVTVIELSAAD